MLKQLIGYKFERKNILRKGTSIENIGKFEFWKEQKHSKYSTNQGVDGLETFQAKNNVPITSGFQLVDYLHMKSGKIDVVGRPQIERQNLMKTQLHWDRC